jgi:hypothetical protein
MGRLETRRGTRSAPLRPSFNDAAGDERPTTEWSPCARGCQRSEAPRPSPQAIRAIGETFPVSCPFKCPRMPADARLFPGQLLAVLCNTLRDNRIVLAAVRVS